MTTCSDARPALAILLLILCATVVSNGCSRSKYRLQADSDAYDLIAERNVDPRWSANQYSIDLDPSSRYFEPYDQDRSPMPPDDPASHQYMHLVDGKKGWKHWHDNGDRVELENPAWREALSEYVDIAEDGSVKLTLDSGLKLAYVHSPSHQNQLETLYLSSLDVTAERFRLDTQFFGGYDVRYAHNGSLIPPGLSYSPVLRRFVITPAVEGAGVENNRLTVGRPFAADPALQARRRLATAGELLVGFANSFVFEFTGSDANLAVSLANFSFIQPLLRGAGKDVALEQLTLDERKLLANLRAFSQYRQGFYTQVAIGELGVTGPQRGGGGTNLQSFSGQGSVGGYLGLLLQLQRIRNSENNLNLQLRTLARLEALLAVNVIDPEQVERFRQSVENERSNLLQSRVVYELALDRYKTSTLGLPPDLPIELDDSLLQQFQLIAREATAIQNSIFSLQLRAGQTPDEPAVEVMDRVLSDAVEIIDPIRRQLDEVRKDLTRMDEAMRTREQTKTAEETEQFQNDRRILLKSQADREREFQEYTAKLESIRSGLSEETRKETRKATLVWISKVARLVERAILTQARARLELISVETIELEPNDAFDIALANRLDFMNGRAALVDRWRLIQFNADALQSVVNVTANGNIRTARNNPLSFRAPTGSVRLGLEFDAPFTRLLERNAYRESLIDYQRSRRDFIQSRDSLHLGLRALLRTIVQLRANLEIQRRAITIAIRRVDLTQADLAAPPAQPGQRFNPTTAINLLSAQTSLRDTQNRFLSVWLDYYAARMRLSRELGVMVLDPDGRWIEYPIPGSDHDAPPHTDAPGAEELPAPQIIPTGWIDLADYVQPPPESPPATMAEHADYFSPGEPNQK